MLEQIEQYSSAKGIELPSSWKYAGYLAGPAAGDCSAQRPHSRCLHGSRCPRGGILGVPENRVIVVEVLVTALTCPDERRARADAAHALVRRGYSWQSVAEKVAGIYDSVPST
jgi:hypothetical protein